MSMLLRLCLYSYCLNVVYAITNINVIVITDNGKENKGYMEEIKVLG